MKRLYGILINTDQWNYKSENKNYSALINKSTLDCYTISGIIIGIEQISDNEFLILRLTSKGNQFLRIRLRDNQKKDTVYIRNFKHYHFLSEDTLLFDNKCVYSIKRNCDLPEFDWIKHKNITLYLNPCKELNDSPYIMLIQEKIDDINLGSVVQVFVETKHFTTITCASSTLRNKHNIELSDEFTFKDLVNADKHYVSILSNIISIQNMESEQNGITSMLQSLDQSYEISN